MSITQRKLFIVSKIETTVGQEGTAAQKLHVEVFDKNVRQQIIIQVGQELFLDRLCQKAFEFDDTDELTDRMYNLIMRKSIGTYIVLVWCPNTIVVDADCITFLVSIGHLNPVPLRENGGKTEHGQLKEWVKK